MKIKLVLAVACGALALNSAHAGIYFNETFFPSISGGNDGTTSATNVTGNTSGLNLASGSTLGLSLPGGFIIGGSFNYQSIKIAQAFTSTVQGSERSISATEFGPTLGYAMGGFHFLASYLVGGNMSTRDKQIDTAGTATSDDTTKSSSGSGFQAQIGCTFSIAGNLRFGPSIAYRNIKYNQREVTNNLTGVVSSALTNYTTKAANSGFSPMLTLIASF